MIIFCLTFFFIKPRKRQHAFFVWSKICVLQFNLYNFLNKSFIKTIIAFQGSNKVVKLQLYF